MADKAGLIAELKQRVSKLPPLEEEPDFITSDETIVRFLKSRDWNVEEAERLLTDSVEYRRRTRPQTLDCSWCHNRPGFHSMRQVGHDDAGRPVMYACFAQASTFKNTPEDSVTHVTYLIENAKCTMGPGVSTWVFVIDCTGMTLSSCNPKLGYSVTNVLSNHYPERLGLVICINHSPVFHGVWKAMKKFLHPNTTAKVCLVRSKSKIIDLFSQLFNPELSAWLHEEISLNKHKPISKTQLEFWNPPSKAKSGSEQHDPRGCPTYVREYIDTFKVKAIGCGTSNCDRKDTPLKSKPTPTAATVVSPNDKATPTSDKFASTTAQTTPTDGNHSSVNDVSGVTLVNDKATSTKDSKSIKDKVTPVSSEASPMRRVFVHKPHPNIVDQLNGRNVAAVTLTKEEQQELLKAQMMMEAEGGAASDMEEDGALDIDIPSDLQIPATAVPLAATS